MLRLMGVQLLFVILASLVIGRHSFLSLESTLLGGTISVVSNLVFAYRFFASGRETQAQRIVHAFYKGELLKFAMIIGLTLLVFTQMDVLILPFVGGLLSATLATWFAPWILSRGNRAVTA